MSLCFEVAQDVVNCSGCKCMGDWVTIVGIDIISKDGCNVQRMLWHHGISF